MSVLAANDPAVLPLSVPVLIAQGSGDPIADPFRTDRLARSLSAGGAIVDRHVYPVVGIST